MTAANLPSSDDSDKIEAIVLNATAAKKHQVLVEIPPSTFAAIDAAAKFERLDIAEFLVLSAWIATRKFGQDETPC